MATRQIFNLPAKASFLTTDRLPVDDNSAQTWYVTGQQILNLVGSNGLVTQSGTQITIGGNTITDISPGSTTSTLGSVKAFTTIFANSADLLATTNQLVLGTTNTTTINSVAPSASRTYSIQDAGGAADILTTLYPGTNTVTWTSTPINFNTTGSAAMNIGSSSYTGTLSIGTTTTTINMLGITTINNTGSNAVSIGTSGYTGTLSLGNGSSTTNMLGAINLNNTGSLASTINIGTSATYTGTVNVCTNSACTLQLGNTAATITANGTISLGPSNTNTQTITLGNSLGPCTTTVAGPLSVTGQSSSFTNAISPASAGGTTLGISSIPWGGLYLGSTSTNIEIKANTPAAARTVTIPDVLSGSNVVLSTQTPVTQITSITTGVSVNGSTGTITTVSISTAASTTAGTFTVTNTFYTSASQIIDIKASFGSSTTGTPYVFVSATNSASNTFNITVRNIDTANALNGTLKIYFLIA